MWFISRYYKQGSELIQREFCTGGREDRTWGYEAEESPLLETVARERLVKPQKAGEGLGGDVVICESWRLAREL
jgi:hypothetical protein